ncbi:MAG: hypothetical protein K0Q66_961, partial [Chitinophagaceae bacterium]|nr:hypothetical protein [Chitinophagaceae bacterium]
GFKPYGYGWPWSDYDASYMPERSFFPIYGNVATFSIVNGQLNVLPRRFLKNTWYSKSQERFRVQREPGENKFLATGNGNEGSKIVIPFLTRGEKIGLNHYSANTNDSLLSDTLGVKVTYATAGRQWKNKYAAIYSQPTDSLLKPMMHRSDNFFAEQSLLMVSNEMLGYMSDTKIIDSLLKTDLKDLPQKPRWVDGSGLSRYNLFSPNDMITVLNKMKNEFSWERITTILPTGGEGTLGSYYHGLKTRIFAKTGTLSNNVALSGFLVTRQNKTFIFSVLVNNHSGNVTEIRKAVEKFLSAVAEKY